MNKWMKDYIKNLDDTLTPSGKYDQAKMAWNIVRAEKNEKLLLRDLVVRLDKLVVKVEKFIEDNSAKLTDSTKELLKKSIGEVDRTQSTKLNAGVKAVFKNLSGAVLEIQKKEADEKAKPVTETKQK